MSQALSADTPAGSFVAGTAVDLRHLIPGISNDDMALSVSTAYEAFSRIDNSSTGVQSKEDKEAMWTAARNSTAHLAARANTLVNQPIRLLQYLANFRKWLSDQIGKPHDSSFEVSNILSFDPFASSQVNDSNTIDLKRQTKSWDIEKVVFS
jgi:hypothetical protein